MKEDLEKVIVDHLKEDIKNFKVLTDSVNEVHSHIREDTEWKKLYAAQNELIIQKIDKVFPVYEDFTGWRDFFRRGKQLGLGLAIFITTLGIILGGVYALREWFRK